MSRLPTVNTRQVLSALRNAGFVDVAAVGGHRQLRRPEGGPRVTVPVHGGHDVPPGTLRNIVRQAGMTPEQFQALL